LKSVDLASKKITKIACLGARVLDGIRVDNQGNFLVSHWEGQTYLVSPDGQVIEILDTMPVKVNSADFEFIKEKNLLIIPTFTDNRVMAYWLE
jgi:sugar lactone lactonase YvrE